MMIQMVDKANTSLIGQDGGNFDLQSFALFKCCCSCASLWTILRGVYPIAQPGSAWLPRYNDFFLLLTR